MSEADVDYIQDLPQAERVALATKLVIQAPPGEIAEVVNDVKLILSDEDAFQAVLKDALPAYHQEQHTVISLPDLSYKTVLADVARLPNTQGQAARYYDPRSGQSFEFDFTKQTASALEFMDLPSETTSYLASYTKPLDAYVADCFTSGAGAIFPHLELGLASAAPSAAPSSGAQASAPTSAIDDEQATVAPDADAETKNDDPALQTAQVETAEEDQTVAEEVEAKREKATDAPTSPDDKVLDTALVETAEEIEVVAPEAEASLGKAEGESAPPENKTLETALVATADEVAEVASKVEEELTAVDAEAATPADQVKAPEEGETADIKEALAEPTLTEEAPQDSPSADGDSVIVPAPSPPSIEAVKDKYALVLSGHRYSPTNFWSGNWRSTWAIDLASDTVQGKIEAIVHYYEQGNVQLRTVETPSFPLPAAGDKQAQSIIDEISKAERAAQKSINERVEELGEKAFRSLRRALPITRQKVDWDKIAGYKIWDAIGGKNRPEEEAAL